MKSVGFMSRRVGIGLGLFLVLTLSVNGLAFGAANNSSTTKTLSTNFTLVNLDKTTTATGSIQYLQDTGAAWAADSANQSFSLSPNGGSVQIKQYFDTTLTPGKGSVVVSSDAALGAVVQIQARGQTPTQGDYSGFSQGSTKFYVPLVARSKSTASGVANSQIIIQNADSSSLNGITVQFIPAPGVVGTFTKTGINLAVGQSFYYDVADEGSLPTEWLGSAVVTAPGIGKIAVVSNFFTGADTMQTFNAFAQESLATNWIVPTLFSRLANGLSTVVTVQNLSGSNIPANTGLTLTCHTTKGSIPATLTVHNPAVLANNASFSFNPVTDSADFPSGWEGSCSVNSGAANVVVLIQLRYVNSPTGNIAADAYEGIRAGGTDKVMFAPLAAKREANGFASVITVQNMTGSQANLTLYYVPAPSVGANFPCPKASCDINHDNVVNALDTIVVTGKTVPANGSLQRNLRLPAGATDAEDTLPEPWEGALRVESNVAIDGYVQLTYYINVAGDQLMAHRVFTRALP